MPLRYTAVKPTAFVNVRSRRGGVARPFTFLDLKDTLARFDRRIINLRTELEAMQELKD